MESARSLDLRPSMTEPILVCTDLDRTLVPNGPQPESPGARACFFSVAERSETRIAYVTSRHLELAKEAMAAYDLPQPDYLVGDVGTTIYTLMDGEWRLDSDWHQEIGDSWCDLRPEGLVRLFSDIAELRLQPPEKQNTHKLSYFTPSNVDVERLVSEMKRRLREQGLEAGLVWSRDEAVDLGLLDVLPSGATKQHAVEFLMGRAGFTRSNTLFAGDSGNDLQVLTSGIPSVLVANASAEVQEDALRLAAKKGTSDSLYLARGGFLGMNGNYSAGIVEGLVHFIPTTEAWFC